MNSGKHVTLDIHISPWTKICSKLSGYESWTLVLRKVPIMQKPNKTPHHQTQGNPHQIVASE